MPPKCKVRKTLPAIGPKGCKAKPEEPWLGYVNDMRRHKFNKKVAGLNDLVEHTNVISSVIKIERQATKNAKMATAALKKANAAATKVNAAATRAKIIGRIKAARGRKHMAVGGSREKVAGGQKGWN